MLLYYIVYTDNVEIQGILEFYIVSVMSPIHVQISAVPRQR